MKMHNFWARVRKQNPTGQSFDTGSYLWINLSAIETVGPVPFGEYPDWSVLTLRSGQEVLVESKLETVIAMIEAEE